MHTLACKVCFEEYGMLSHEIVEHRCTNARTGNKFNAYVCKNCLDNGRETRVTCRTFVGMPDAANCGYCRI